MTAYYNDNDPFVCAWLRELIKAGLIAPGEVDERSIEEVKPDDLRGFTQCHFFAGIGVWSYALRAAGWADDLAVWTGSCPCQGFSASGQRGGFSDKRHLWPAWFRLISECRPVAVFGEQVASKDGLAWLDVVSADMEAEGYAIGAADTCAAGFGAPHIRQRLYFVGHAASGRFGMRGSAPGKTGRATQPEQRGDSGLRSAFWSDVEWIFCKDGKCRPTQPGLSPLAHGVANRVGKLRGYGNALVAPQAQAFIEAYMSL